MPDNFLGKSCSISVALFFLCLPRWTSLATPLNKWLHFLDSTRSNTGGGAKAPEHSCRLWLNKKKKKKKKHLVVEEEEEALVVEEEELVEEEEAK